MSNISYVAVLLSIIITIAAKENILSIMILASLALVIILYKKTVELIQYRKELKELKNYFKDIN